MEKVNKKNITCSYCKGIMDITKFSNPNDVKFCGHCGKRLPVMNEK